ncbi:MAG: right-handed parallel beta-helix repeat-containing protein [Candidatus Marinimicrobia bacterium]|nr:right-handed parallel beta-helix repeat-containing protein [Candidatus Neomarinimicrobiota bacterium]
MNRILFLLIFCTFSLSETILIPEDYLTIQEGIDASVDGDTVLVADGDYVENLVLNKSIVLTSYAIYDNLDEWVIFDNYFLNQWVINNPHISNTRIIGSSPDDPDFGSVILITPDSDECISPEIVGFTIQGGSGTTVLRDGNPVVLGGGILADVSDPYIHHNAFENNGSEEVYSGGAAQLTSSAEDWSFDNRFENYNPRCDVEEFRLSHNLYNGNDAQYGNSMANRYHEDEFDMSGSIFDVFDCGNEESAVSTIWVKVEPAASVDYDDGAGQLCAFTAPDVYVDSNIPQECLDEGCGFLNNPFKTIVRALEMINATEDNPITIHLAAGTYSPETGENFPIIMQSNLNIEGEDEETTILDAMETGGVVTMEYCDNNSISGITITGGLAEGEYPNNYGGGMYIWSSNPTLTNVTITDNTAMGYGGGMCLSYSNPTLTNVTITDNTGMDWGGGMYLYYSNPTLNNVTISNNTASVHGGGMYAIYSDPTLNNVTITNNTAYTGGGMYLYYSNPTLNNVTISNNTASVHGGGMYAIYSDPTLNNVTITNNTAYTGGGMYLYYSNPTLNNVTISNNTASVHGGGMYAIYSDPTLNNVTITNNTAYTGGGMYLYYSNPTLNNVTISNNTAENYGGGLYLFSSNPTLTHVTISNNTANYGGGGIFLDSSHPTLTHVTISNNTAENYGGGLYLFSSNPTLTHVTISNNTANYGGGMILNSNPILTNSIIWGNNPESIDISSGEPIITYSDIEGGWEGEGNIDTDPLFTDSENGDYTLQENSPCIDVGTADLDGDGVDDITDFIGSAPDMGAFEFGESSEIMAGDTNFDGIVDILDIVRIVNNIMGNSEFNDDEFTAADFNADGIVDILDIVQIINYILDN